MKLLSKSFLFLALMTIIVSVLNHFIPNQYETERAKVRWVVDNFQNVKSLTFGRSHAGSLDYKYYDKEGENFALGGRDLASIDYLLQYLLPKCDSIKEVILFISYTSLYFDNTAMSSGNLNDARKALYYSVPSLAPINMMDINNLFFGKVLQFVQPDHGYNLIRDFYNSESKANTLSYKSEIVLSDDEMILSGQKQAQRDVLDIRSALNYDDDIMHKNCNVLKNIVLQCKRGGVNLIIVQAPYHQEYSSRVPCEVKNELSVMVRGIASQFNIQYFDFSADERFAKNNSLFMNSDHLNKKGKQQFTEIFNVLTK